MEKMDSMKTRVWAVALLIILGLLMHVSQCRSQSRDEGSGTARSKLIDLYIILDNSVNYKQEDPASKLSMYLTDFVRKFPSDSRIGIIVYDEKYHLMMPLIDRSNPDFNRLLDGALGKLDYKGRLSNGPVALERALREITEKGRPSSRKAILYFTSGPVDTGDSKRNRDLTGWFDENLPVDAYINHIELFCIGFGSLPDMQLLKTVSRKTSGDSYQAMTLSDIQSILTNLNRIFISGDVEPVSIPQDMSIEIRKKGWRDNVDEYGIEILIAGSIIAGFIAIFIVSKIFRNKKARKIQAELAERRLRLSETRRRTMPSTPPVPVKQHSPAPKEEPEDAPDLTLPSVAAAVKAPERFDIFKESSLEVVMPPARLIDLYSVSGKEFLALDKAVVTVGRDKAINDLVIPKNTISKQHARIEFRDGVFYLVDMRSTNGTFLNGQRISESNRKSEEPLKNNDMIAFDTYQFQFIRMDEQDDRRTIVRPFDNGADARKPKGDPFAATVILQISETDLQPKREGPGDQESKTEILDAHQESSNYEKPSQTSEEQDYYSDSGSDSVKKGPPEEAAAQDSKETSEETGITLDRISMKCYNHPDVKAVRTCLSCNHSFCEECIVLKDDVYICKDCAPFYETENN